MKELLKKLLKKLPVSFTQNQKYDRLTEKIIRKLCRPSSCCVDVGCHKGEITDLFLKYAPQGKHFAFEPLPLLFSRLEKKYQEIENVKLFKLALSNETGDAPFNFVVSNPAYSGLKKRRYDRPEEKDMEIWVKTEKMDQVIGPDDTISLIKIDVEGGEYQVLEGAVELLKRDKPVILFEHGRGGSLFYGSTPDKLYSFFRQLNYSISLLDRYLKSEEPFSEAAFTEQFNRELNFFFIAYPNP